MQFEWDEAKAARNLARHGIDFDEASEVFFDPLHIEIEDVRFEYGERRMKAIGEFRGRLFVVVFTQRQDAVRIISARKAEPYERREYREGHSGKRTGPWKD